MSERITEAELVAAEALLESWRECLDTEATGNDTADIANDKARLLAVYSEVRRLRGLIVRVHDHMARPSQQPLDSTVVAELYSEATAIEKELQPKP